MKPVDVILSDEQAAHINERRVDRHQHLRTAKFVNLTSTLGLLSRRTWETRADVKLTDEGWERDHGHFSSYSFDTGKFVGASPCNEIALYYYHNTAISDKFRIITAYPFSNSYHNYFISISIPSTTFSGRAAFSAQRNQLYVISRCSTFFSHTQQQPCHTRHNFVDMLLLFSIFLHV